MAPGARLTLLFFLYAAASLSLLFAPFGNFHSGAALGAWVVCIVALIALGKAAVSFHENLATVVTRYLLFVFALFFAAERLAADAFSWSGAVGWVQFAVSIALVLGAAILLPRLRNTREGSAALHREHDRFLAAAESTLDDFYIFDGVSDASGQIVDFRFSYINPNAERRLGVKRGELIGKILTEERPFMIRSGLIEKYREVVRTGVPYTCEIYLDDERISDTWLNVQVVRLGSGIAITSRDVTERKRLTDRAHYLAHHDQLTGLPNRTLLQDRLQQTIIRAERQGHRFAIFMVDIDYFKRINDSHGHADGDAVLAAVGERLRAAVREADTVARMGGDEFVVIMPEVESLADVRLCGLKLVRSAAQPVPVASREIGITVSVGVCFFPDHGRHPEELLRAADEAMYSIKDSGRNGVHIFGEEIPEEPLETGRVANQASAS